MNRYYCIWVLAFLGLLLVLSTDARAQGASDQSATVLMFEAPLMTTIDGQPVRKGTVQATLEGEKLRLYGALNGLHIPWIQADLYHGDPVNGGTAVKNLAIRIADPNALGGGFDTVITLSEAEAADLLGGQYYISIAPLTADPLDWISGPLAPVASAPEVAREAPLSYLWLGTPVARGSVQAMVYDGNLRLLGFFNGLASNWQVITLSLGAPGTAGQLLTSIWNLPLTSGLYGGFDMTFDLQPGWAEALADGQMYVKVDTGRPSDSLQGRLRTAANQAPAAAAMIAPVEGEIIHVGGTLGTDPVDPNVYLGQVQLTPADDPDGDPVVYLWQASLHPGFSSATETVTFDLGVGTTSLNADVAFMAALFDQLTNRQPGDVLLHTPVTVYHRALTTDGARYAIGPTVTSTFVRGTLTANEPPDALPAAFVLHGNYPNPFNPTTTLSFDLPTPADVAVEVFDLLGRTVMAIPAQPMAAGARQRIMLDASTLATGPYLYRITAQAATGRQVSTGMMTLLR